MTSKDEIKNAFIAELKNTPEYQIILNIKQKLLDEIAAPNIQSMIRYNFDESKSQEEQANIRLCSIVEFGFEIYVNEFCAEIHMDKFLN